MAAMLKAGLAAIGSAFTSIASTIVAIENIKDKPKEFMIDKVMAMVVQKADGIVNIEMDISNLQTTLRMIQSIVQVAEEKQIEDDFIRKWLRDLVDVGYEARDVLEDFIAYSSCIRVESSSRLVIFISSQISFLLSYFGGLSCETSELPLTVLNQLEKDIRSVRERFDEKTKEGEKFAILRAVVGGGGGSESEEKDIKICRPEVGPYLNQQSDNLFLGREEVKEGIMKKILHPGDNRVHVVAIRGMGGIGKTTLAQFIYNDERVQEVSRSWLCVGENKLSAEKVIREIVNDQNTTCIVNLQNKLVEKLRGERFLIVLDDVWDVDGSEWDLLLNPLTCVGKGGLIIITTRRRGPSTKFQTTYDLKPLSEEVSWSIFESCAYVNGKSDSTLNLKGFGEKIVKKLNGHPLALKVVGRSLLNKDSSTWTNFLESKLTKDDEVMSALRWSYKHLPPHLKMCFTYCSLFPKDHVFDKKVLVEMWMAHDFIQKEEDVGSRYFEELLNASLLQCVDGKYTMHDLIHDLALLVSNGEFATTDDSLSIGQMDKVRHVTIAHGDYSKIPRLCQIEKLLTLYTIRRYKIYTNWCHDSVLCDVFKQPKGIRVLVLSSKHIKEIPDCTSELRHLRYLDVSETSVESLPDSLCDLYHLQTLAAPLDAILPRNIVNMANLRHLRANLSTCKGVGKLTSLQELSSIHVCEDDNIRELGDMQLLRGELTIRGLGNVQKLEDDVGALMEKQTLMNELVLQFDKQLEDAVGATDLENVEKLEDTAGALMDKQTLIDELELVFNQHLQKSTISAQVLDALGCPPYLKCLKIVYYEGLKPPSWMVDGKQKFDKLQTLELSFCPKLESLPHLGELTSLKHLSLVNVGVKKLGDEFYGKFTDGKVFFPSLESLSFRYMQEWEQWDDIIINNSNMSFFPLLTRLEIIYCAKIVSVLPVIKNRTSKRKRNTFKRPQTLELSSLKSLYIEGCPQLQSLPSNFHKLSFLEKLYIKSCPQLQSLPQSLGKLSSLQFLGIYSCEKLQSLPRDFHKLSSLKNLCIEGYRHLQSLPPNFHKLSSLKSLSIKDCPQLKSLPPDFHRLSSLWNLCIEGFPELQSLPPNFHMLSSLVSLRIKSCPQLQSLPPYFHKLSSLVELSIDDCPELQLLPSDFHELSSLENLSINRCPKLQSLPPNLHMLSSLKFLFIEDCPQLQLSIPYFNNFSSLDELHITSCPQNQSLKRSINSLAIAYQQLPEERCKLESGHVWHQIKHIRNLYLYAGNLITVFGGTLGHYREGEEEEEEEEEEKEEDKEDKEEKEKTHHDSDNDKEDQDDDHSDDDLLIETKIMASAIGTTMISTILQSMVANYKEDQDDDHSDDDLLIETKIMASAIGTTMVSTILQPMVAKAWNIIKDKGLVIGRYIADKVVDKAVDKPMDKVMAMVVVDKVDGMVNIKRDISSLHTTLCMIEGIVQIAEKKQIDDDDIQNWLLDLVDIGYEARDVLDDFITFSSCIIKAEETSNPVNFISSFMLSYFGGSSSDTSNIPLAVLNRLAKDIRSVRERFDKKNKEGKIFKTLKSVVGGGSESVRVDRRPEVGPCINKQRDGLFLGREEVKQGIMEKILHPSDDHRVHVVAIWGMGGVGKTTLAQSIYNDERVKKDDYPTKNRSWLYVGENKFCAEKVIKEIVNDSSNNDVESLKEKLVEKLRGDRFLIVLDDVWDVDGSEWKSLFTPLTNVGKGGLIIITTRKREVCTATNTQTTYDLQPLSEEDSWSIFESYAYVNGKSDSPPNLKGIGKEIVKKLNGLPSALKVVGCSLLGKDPSTWTNFLESKLTKDDEVMSALIRSYNHLPQHLKMCFTYCALFPKDHVLDEKVLVEMWMAHDLIEKEEQKRPEDVEANYFKQLVNASLLQCVDGKYTMYDLIHDLALLVSNGEFATTDDSLPIGQMDKVRHITITRGDYSKIPRLCQMEKLLTLYTICNDEEDPERFDNYGEEDTNWFDDFDLYDVFNQFKSIRVMVLSSYGIYEIPDCISELKHLRYLDVSKTSVESLPNSLCDLYHLQTLAAPLDAVLPRNIVNMVNLRYVRANLSTCKGVGKLTSLQELSSIHVCEGDNIRELGDMQRLRGKLTIKDLENVEKLEDTAGALMDKQTLIDELELVFNQHLQKSTISAQVLDALGCPPYLKCLKIVNYEGLKPPSWMVDGKQKFDKLQTLELSFCPKLESLPHLGELTSLKHLSLVNVGVKKLGDEFYGKFTDGKVFFPSLESLSFGDMEGWEQWDDIIIENSSVSFFPCLTRLEIDHCPKLDLALPVVKNRTSKRKREDKHRIMNASNFMTSLSSLKIWNCDGLKQLQISQCEHLRKMDIRSCDKLISIPCLLGIKFLYLTYCKSLTTLCINDRVLDSLEYLLISDCPVLELTLKKESSSSSGAVRLEICTDKKQIFTKLFHGILAKFENSEETEANNSCKLRSLKSLCISRCKDLMSLPEHFYKLLSLNSLKIENCPKLQSLCLDFYKLCSLERLEIISCPKFRSLPSDFDKLPALNSLKIVDCPQLQSLPAGGFPSSMESLELLNCPLLYERCKDESGFDWHKIKRIPKLTIFGDHKVHRYGGDW